MKIPRPVNETKKRINDIRTYALDNGTILDFGTKFLQVLSQVLNMIGAHIFTFFEHHFFDFSDSAIVASHGNQYLRTRRLKNKM